MTTTTRKRVTRKSPQSDILRPRQRKPKLPRRAGRKVHVIYLIDESGSMGGQRNAVVNGFNDYIATLREQRGVQYKVTLSFFTTKGARDVLRLRTLYQGLWLEEVPTLQHHMYQPDAATPLYDAIHHTAFYGETWEENNEGWAILYAIVTDGYENASREYSLSQTKCLLAQAQEGRGWTVLFMGAGLEVAKRGLDLGLNVGNTYTYRVEQTQDMFKGVGAITRGFASNYVSGQSMSSLNACVSTADLTSRGIDNIADADPTGTATTLKTKRVTKRIRPRATRSASA
jgi:hypothetical protein